MASPGMVNAPGGPEQQAERFKKIRRRIGRACDQCNALRTKCDGRTPCARCSEGGQQCEYNRIRKKRGKVPAKGRSKEAVNTSESRANPDEVRDPSRESDRSDASLPLHPLLPQSEVANTHDSNASMPSMFPAPANENYRTRRTSQFSQHTGPLISTRESHRSPNYNGDSNTPKTFQPYLELSDTRNDQTEQLRISDYGGMSQMLDPQAFDDIQAPIGSFTANSNHAAQRGHSDGHRYNMTSPLRRERSRSATFNAPVRNSVIEAQVPSWLGAIPAAQSPNHFSLPSVASPHAETYPMPRSRDQELADGLRYPVLRPALPYIASIIPQSLACELLELYFTSLTTAFLHPTSSYVTAYVFRKASFLHPTRPRMCSPALLVSMLWIAAQTSDASLLTASITARGKVCQKLLEVTINLLKPLVHQPNSAEDSSNTVINGVALGGFGVNVNLPLPGGRHSAGTTHLTTESSAEVDDIATYIHLATVISASEYKAASIRWWSVVWSLTRELRFGREVPRPETQDMSQNGTKDAGLSMDSNIPITEESREERRRIWWLAYTVDRHLSICYNQPLSLRDVDCISLLRPVPESHWQAGDEYYGPPAPDSARPRGPGLECLDHGIFGFFTPLMTICGECIELQQARSHPRLGQDSRPPYEWDSTAALIRSHLDTYAESLAAFRAHHLPEMLDTASSIRNNPPLTEHQLQTIIVLAYAEHIMHVMHVLVTGKWDPITLLDDADMWISSDAFLTASNHAVEAAQALSPILEYDPDLSFMPWFFGIYLLQGSFLLLLFADKLGTNADERHVGACERCVRAIEACVVTLNTEYQRNFRKVMRSALAQVRGRTLNDFGDQQFRRRELLSHYRWSGDGGGLAL